MGNLIVILALAFASWGTCSNTRDMAAGDRRWLELKIIEHQFDEALAQPIKLERNDR